VARMWKATEKLNVCAVWAVRKGRGLEVSAGLKLGK
jgi:hypothetical protein